MKNTITTILIIAALAGLGLGIWGLRSGLPIPEVLPSNPLVFVRLNNVEKHINQVIHSDLGKNIASIDLSDVLSRNKFSIRDIRDFQHWQKDMVSCWDNPLVKRFLGKEAAMALYRQKHGYQIFVTLRLTLSTRLVEFLVQLSQHWGDGVAVGKERYHDRTINHIVFEKQGLSLAYVRIRDLLVIVPGSTSPLKNVIDIYARKQGSLRQDAAFNFVRQNAYSKADGMVFVDLDLFSDLWRGEMDSRLTSLGYQTAAFPVYGLSYTPGVVSKYKMIIGFNEKYLPAGVKRAFACPASSNDTLRFVPMDAIAYHWGGCYDFNQTWNVLESRLQENPELAQTLSSIKERFEKRFQLDIKKDLVPLLGQQVGGYLTDVDMQGTYPFPRLLLFIKILDRPAAEKLLDKLTQNPGSLLHHELYDNVDIHYVSLPLGGNIDPGYAFLDDYLLLASSRQLIKRSIEAYNDSLRSIVSDDTISQFSLGNGKKFHSVTLMKTAELSRRAQDFLGWVDKYLSGQVSMAAAYKQDGDSKTHELDEAIADKSEELVLAQKKLTQLKTGGSLGRLPIADPELVNGAIANLSRQEDAIREDIANYKEQEEDISKLLENYAVGAQSAKLTMYNMDTVVSPVLKGLESIDAQAVTVKFGDKVLETEFLVK